MDGLVNFYETDFCVAVIPLQLVMLVYYAAGKRLPLRESWSFFLLMLVNLVSMVLSLCTAAMNFVIWEHSFYLVYAVDILYTAATPTRPYMMFRYMADAFLLSGRRGRMVRGGALLLYLAVEVVAFTTPLTGALFWLSSIYGFFHGPLYQFLPVYYGLYLILSAALVLSMRSAGRTRSTTFLAALVLMAVGNYWKYVVGGGHVLVMGYFTTMSLFLLFLTRRNPALYTDDLTGLFNKDALTLVLKDHFIRERVAGIGFALRDFETLRVLYGGTLVDDFLSAVQRYVEQTFPKAYGFYLNGGRFFFLFDGEVDVQPVIAAFHAWFTKPWKDGRRSYYFGVGCCGIPGSVRFRSAEEVQQALEMALDEAGRLHGGDVVVDEDFLSKVKRSAHVQNLLLDAVKNKKVQMFLQPVVDAATGRLEGAEALARLTGPDGKTVPPAEFIPAAESTGAIHALGLQMMDRACAFIGAGGLARCGMKWINVNVAPLQCLEEDLAGSLDAVRQKHHVALSQIRLEITEESTLSARGLAQVEALHRLGYSIALDDFGSGYSNSSRMRKMPLLEVKLDMGLVRSHFRHPDSFLGNAVKNFHDQGLAVVAEGVEYQEWADELARMGVDYLQGYLYSRPIPVDEFLAKYGKKNG